jgi:hypothetical protein
MTRRSRTKKAPGQAHAATPEDVVFACKSTPGHAIAVPSGWAKFEGGRVILTDPRDIAALRKHPWYGGQIRELTPEEAARPWVDKDAQARWEAYQRECAEKSARVQERRRMFGPAGPLIPR